MVWVTQLTVGSAVPATAMITSNQLLRLAGERVDLRPRPVKGTPSLRVGPVVALAADPPAPKLLKITKLVGAFGLRVHGRGVGGVVARRCETRVPVEVSGDTVVVGHGGVLARVPLWVTNAHLQCWDQLLWEREPQ